MASTEAPWLQTEAYNATVDLLKEAECLARQRLQPDDPGLFCPTAWDRVLCWPRTAPGTLALLPCFNEFQGIPYYNSQNASRVCHGNGTWDSFSNYRACMVNPVMKPSRLNPESEVTSSMYYVGYALSLVALSVAICIFISFKDLRCLRNTIHTNLMATYLITDFLWILNISLQTSTFSDGSCVVLTMLNHYFLVATYFWMFVEGLYLYLLVVQTFRAEYVKFRVYAIIGWGAPVPVVVLWSVVKSVTPLDTPEEYGDYLQQCLGSQLMVPHDYDWIFKGPIIFVLAVNIVFLVMIMWVLITKLRSASTVETQQYRKATKALLVLMPLLGIAYLLTLYGPTEGVIGNIFTYLRVITISIQGFTVALFYCFLNTEVQNTMRYHLNQWRTKRTLHVSRRYTYSKDWSPRSRTESIRLFALPATHGRKRESTVSEVTTTTLVGGCGSLNGQCSNAV